MNSIIGWLLTIALLVGLGAGLLAANIWYGRTLWSLVSPESQAPVLAPFVVTGKSEGETLGMSLARMLQSRLRRIGEGIDASRAALEQAADSMRPQVRPSVVGPSAADPVTVPSGVFVPVELDLEVGGVQLGGVLSFFQRWRMRRRTLTFTVNFTDDDRAHVSGFVDIGRSRSLWLETDGGYVDLVDAVAFSLMQSQFAASTPQVGALEWNEFRHLVQALQQIVTLNNRMARGRSSPSDFEEPLERLQQLVELLPEWPELLRVAAETAEKAEKRDVAHDLYVRLKALLDPDTPEYAALERRIAELSPPPPDRVVAGGGDRLVALVGAGAGAPETRAPTIAVAGGVPSAADAPGVTILGDGPAPEGSDWAADYMDRIVEVVRLIAPDAELLFHASASPLLARSLPGAIRAFGARRPDVLLVPISFTSGAFDPVTQALLALEDVPVVVSARMQSGAGPESLIGADQEQALIGRHIVVSPTDLEGRPAFFARSFEGAFWAPGVDVPYILDGEPQTMSGSGPAAAIAAAVVGRARRTLPDLAWPELRDLLERTAVEVAPGSGIRVLNLEAAISAATVPR